MDIGGVIVINEVFRQQDDAEEKSNKSSQMTDYEEFPYSTDHPRHSAGDLFQSGMSGCYTAIRAHWGD